MICGTSKEERVFIVLLQKDMRILEVSNRR